MVELGLLSYLEDEGEINIEWLLSGLKDEDEIGIGVKWRSKGCCRRRMVDAKTKADDEVGVRLGSRSGSKGDDALQ